MIKIIAAVSSDNIIGGYNGPPGEFKKLQDYAKALHNFKWEGKLPWTHEESKGDLKLFKEMTYNSNVIMGRRTYESIGEPLDGRMNIVVSSSDKLEFTERSKGVQIFQYLRQAVEIYGKYPTGIDTWIIGGGEIFREGMYWAEEIYITRIPVECAGRFDDVVEFPRISRDFELESVSEHPYNPKLKLEKYTRVQ